MLGIGKKRISGPLVIVGNGMASWRLCQGLVARNVHQRREILVFGDEPQPAYDRVNLTRYFDLENPDDLLLSGSDWYAGNGIQLRTGTRIQSIDPEHGVVRDAFGNAYSYGDCILATGSRPRLPAIEGIDDPGVHVYRTIADLEHLRWTAGGSRTGLVIGGGLLGLEAASVLQKLGIETTIVQLANSLMSRQLNEDGAACLLAEVASQGMRVRLSTETRRIERTGSILRVHFNNGNPLEVDFVVVAAGVVANDELAATAGIRTAPRGGIMVDDRLRTSAPGVYAMGDCVTHRGTNYGLVAPAYQMADVLAARFSGVDRVFKGCDQSCRLKLMGVEVSVFGDYMEEGTYFVHRGPKSFRSVVIRRNRIIGGTVVGPWNQTMQLEMAVRENRRMRTRQLQAFERGNDLFDAGAASQVAQWPDAALVCHCTSTTCGTLKRAVADGCHTLESLCSRTGAGTVCGSCVSHLAEFAGEDVRLLTAQRTPRGRWFLLGSAIAGLLVLAAYAILFPLPVAGSVQSVYYNFSKLWQNSVTKQVTGYSLAGLSLLAILLSARKRWRWMNWGNYGFWRAAHGWLGLLTLSGIFFHTGLQAGQNLNFWLLACFLGLNCAGALAAVAVAAEQRLSGRWGLRLRSISAKAHIVFFLPYPVLLAAHITKIYLY